jgi:carbon-monoxide dehydrogenase medium subunit
MLLPKLEYLAPKTGAELAGYLADHKGKAKILAGGTDVIPNMLEKLYKADYLIDVNGIEELQGISYAKGKGLTIGAATKLEDIERSKIVGDNYTALQKAASEVGSPQIRAMASLAGNSCNASPAADTPPALVALGAKVSIVSKSGKREMALEDFIQGNRKIDLKPDEYVEKFILPDGLPNSASRFGLLTLTAAKAIDVVSVAVSLAVDPGSKKVTAVQIAMGSVAPVPIRAKKGEKVLLNQVIDDALIEKAAEACGGDAKPIDDIRGSAAYRQHVVKVLANRTIKETLAAIG